MAVPSHHLSRKRGGLSFKGGGQLRTHLVKSKAHPMAEMEVNECLQNAIDRGSESCVAFV
jgi:hypothetical protein